MSQELYVVSVEGRGDGSGNWDDFNRPGISVYTAKNKLIIGIQAFLPQKTKKEVEDIIDDGGYRIDEDSWIRIDRKPRNPPKLQDDHWSDWDLGLENEPGSDPE